MFAVFFLYLSTTTDPFSDVVCPLWLGGRFCMVTLVIGGSDRKRKPAYAWLLMAQSSGAEQCLTFIVICDP